VPARRCLSNVVQTTSASEVGPDENLLTSAIDAHVHVFGEADPRSLEQLRRSMGAQGEGRFAVLNADHHVGYSQPIGGGVAFPDHLSVTGVGFDVGCGNKAALTDLTEADVAGDVPRLMDEIARTISFGVGRVNAEKADHPVLDRIAQASFYPGKSVRAKLRQRAASQLGTVGAGNHYVNLAADERGRVWVGVHFGSRGFGHGVATGFINLANGRRFDDGELKLSADAPPVLLPARSGLGEAYGEAMALAGEYAYAGRDWVVARVLAILGARSVEEIHNHHNFAWRERHHGTELWVVRKGCTPAFPGQKGFVGGSMGEDSVILEGVDSEASRAGLYSTVHGAGRVMSRTQAAGKSRMRWACVTGDWAQPPRSHKPSRCPLCGGKLVRSRVQVSPGQVDWPAVRERLARQGIVLRGGAADEAPEVYKRLPEVLAAHAGTIRVLHTLRPLGVAMAGAGTVDPFKD
jgi:tRNA-splicing ligase RtcB